MIDREKVIKGLECCSALNTPEGRDRCEECPYNEVSIFVHDCRAVLSTDALDLLKEQQETELCDRCGRVRLKSKWEGR